MGKGSKPRNCFSKQFKANYDAINWAAKKTGAEWKAELCPEAYMYHLDGWKGFESAKIDETEFWRKLNRCATPNYLDINGIRR